MIMKMYDGQDHIVGLEWVIKGFFMVIREHNQLYI